MTASAAEPIATKTAKLNLGGGGGDTDDDRDPLANNVEADREEDG